MLEQTCKQESLKQWYLKYIDYFREEYKKLSADEKATVNNTNNFLNPCQIEIFWITDPDYQLIVQSNFNDRPDKEIIVNGPYKPHEFQSNVIPVLKDKRWMRKVKEVLPYRYEQFSVLGEKMALNIYGFIEMIKNYPFASQKRANRELIGRAFEDTWTRIRVGDIGELDHTQEINNIIQAIKAEAKNKQERLPTSQQPTSFTNDKYDGFGVHLFPPMVIGSKYKRSIDELIYNSSNLWINDDKVFDMMIGDNQSIVNKDGFIFVESKSKEDALKILNLIMAHGAFYGFPLHTVREQELVTANYNKQKLIVTDMGWNTETKRAYLLDDSFNSKYRSHNRKTEIKPDTMKEILSSTEKLLVHEKLSEEMRILNEGLTHFVNSEFAPSFIMSWSVMERHYYDLWSELLSQKNIDTERLSKLTNVNQWTIDYVLEVLNLQNKIDENSYDLLMELKRKRNKYYHSGKQVMKEDADRCLNYAMRLLVEKIQQHTNSSDNPLFYKYLNEMKSKDH